MSARVWSLALATSALVHAGGFAVLALTIKPDPTEDQPRPTSKFTVEAAEVKRSRAEPQQPPSDPAAEGIGQATRAEQSAVRQSRATASPTDSAQIGASPPPSTPVRAKRDAQRVPAVTAAGTKVAQASSQAGGETVQSASLTGQVLSLATVTPATTTAAAPKAAQTLPLSSPQAPAAASVTPTAPAASSATPNVYDASTLPLPATKGTAALAWSGSDNTAVSATSLAAIAAFTQAGDVSGGAAQVRDGIAGILAAVPCARLQTTFLPDSGTLELRGHLPEDALRAPVLAALREQVGDAIPISDALLILPRPQCGALAGIAAVGLPQSTEQLTNPAVIGEDGFARNYSYADGQRLTLDLTAPDYDAFVYVDYFAADGSVIHLQPNDVVPLPKAVAKSALAVGRSIAGEPALDMTISAPFGQEIAAAFATSAPLYDGLRPLQEPAGPYLEFLAARVTAMRAKHADFKGEWVYFFISTTPN
tara:strand:+ start:112606 stop:114042 length:1437 start_codon:yes stop_codon:yes gene_type:complete